MDVCKTMYNGAIGVVKLFRIFMAIWITCKWTAMFSSKFYYVVA